MGRKKVSLEFIANDYKRKSSYMKRKQSLLKMTEEICILCGIQACAIVFGPYDPQPEVWPSESGVLDVLGKFRSIPDWMQSKKTVNQESFIRQSIVKGKEKLKKLEQDNKEAQMSMFMLQCLNTGTVQHDNNMTTADLNALSSMIEQNLKEITRRIQLLNVNQVPEVPFQPQMQTPTYQPHVQTLTNEPQVQNPSYSYQPQIQNSSYQPQMQTPIYQPHLQTLIDEPQMQNPSYLYQPQTLNPSYQPQMQTPIYHPHMQTQTYQPQVQNPSFQPPMQTPTYQPYVQTLTEEPQMQNSSYSFQSQIQNSSYQPQIQAPIYHPDIETQTYQPHMQAPAYEPEVQTPTLEEIYALLNFGDGSDMNANPMENPSYHPPMQTPSYQPHMQAPTNQPEVQTPRNQPEVQTPTAEEMYALLNFGNGSDMNANPM